MYNRNMPQYREPQKVRIEMPHGHYRIIHRVVRNSRWTGLVTTGWMGTKFWQWEGYVKYEKKEIKVWGYQTYGSGTPDEWANDTY